ncbi:iron chaperone [Microbacterium sp. NPDC091313]
MATKDDGLTAEERQAVKDRAKELREQAKAGKNREAGEKAIREAIEKLDGTDREIGEGLYAVVNATAPDLLPKTYYGMPAYANDAGKVVVFLQPADKFKARYATIGFEDRAQLDDGDFWPIGFAVTAWTPAVQTRVTELVRTAVGG